MQVSCRNCNNNSTKTDILSTRILQNQLLDGFAWEQNRGSRQTVRNTPWCQQLISYISSLKSPKKPTQLKVQRDYGSCAEIS